MSFFFSCEKATGVCRPIDNAACGTIHCLLLECQRTSSAYCWILTAFAVVYTPSCLLPNGFAVFHGLHPCVLGGTSQSSSAARTRNASALWSAVKLDSFHRRGAWLVVLCSTCAHVPGFLRAVCSSPGAMPSSTSTVASRTHAWESCSMPTTFGPWSRDCPTSFGPPIF